MCGCLLDGFKLRAGSCLQSPGKKVRRAWTRVFMAGCRGMKLVKHIYFPISTRPIIIKAWAIRLPIYFQSFFILGGLSERSEKIIDGVLKMPNGRCPLVMRSTCYILIVCKFKSSSLWSQITGFHGWDKCAFGRRLTSRHVGWVTALNLRQDKFKSRFSAETL